MVTSPSGKGVILICGMLINVQNLGSSFDIIHSIKPTIEIHSIKPTMVELTGNSKESLKWTVLDQTVNDSDHYLAFPYV